MINVVVDQQRSLQDRAIWRTQPHVLSLKEEYFLQTVVTLDFDIVGTFSIEWKYPKPHWYQAPFNGLSGPVVKLDKAAHGGYMAWVDFSKALPSDWHMATTLRGFTSDVYYLCAGYYRVTFDQDIDKIYVLALKD